MTTAIKRDLADNTEQTVAVEPPLKRWLLPLVIVIAGLIGLIAFAPKTAQAPQVRVVAQREENKALVQQVYASPGPMPDLELVAQLFAPDFQYHLIYGSVTVHSPEGHKAFEDIYWSVYFPRHHILETLVPGGEMVLTRWTWPTSGYAHDPTESPFTASPEEAQSVSGTTIWRIVDGKIADAWIILE